MAEIAGWFTTSTGQHIPYMKGQSKAEAAQKYMSSKHGKTVARLSSKTYTKKENLSNLQKTAREQSWNDFRNNIRNKDIVNEMKSNGIKSLDDMRKYWVSEKMKDFTSKDIKELSKQDAIKLVNDNISKNIMDGWFRNADSSYKTQLETSILENKQLRNAGLNIAYHNYKEQTGSNISFNEFTNKSITMYRGEHGQKTLGKDVFKAYTTDKKIAEKFGDNINQIKIKPKDTLGSYQTTGENEYLIPINKL